MIHLTITIDNAAELLNVNAYGAGALLRWERAAAVGGVYVEGGTVALVSGTSLYDVWDAAGVDGVTWYRTRISNAAGSSFSGYSAQDQSGPASLITVAQLAARLRVSFAGDELTQVQGLIEDASALVIHVAGTDFATSVPGVVVATVAQMIRRALDNPAELTGEHMGAYGWQAGQAGQAGTSTAGGAIYVTRTERKFIREAAGRPPIVSISVTSGFLDPLSSDTEPIV